jgi:hypothetical protein
MRHCHPYEPGHPSVDAELLFRRSDARSLLAAKGLWRSAGFRYCQLYFGTAAVVKPNGINLRAGQLEREHSTSVTKIGFTLGSAAIETTAWLFSLPAAKDPPSELPKPVSRILIGTETTV